VFARLVDLSAVPIEVRRFHERSGRFSGRAVVTSHRPLIARLMGLPQRSGEFDVHVDVERDGDAEVWTRHFPPRPMRSRLQADGGWLVERLGVVTLRFALTASAEALDWHCVDVRWLGLPLPARWFRVVARESARDGKYRFVAGASLPLLGELVHYEGWLDV
jgi:hypothetical protein